MRMIDADAYIKMMEEKCDHDAALDECILKVCRGGINMMPTIEPEQIRCENCKRCETTDNYNYCKAWQRETSIDGYCHMGDAND